MKKFFLGLALLVTGCATQTIEEDTSVAWVTLDAGDFTVQAPSDWIFTPEMGIDSTVGKFSDGDMTLIFDYGMYTGDFTNNSVYFEDASAYILIEESINGLDAKIYVPGAQAGKPTVLFIANPRGVGPCTEGVCGLSEENFEMLGDNLNEEEIDLAIQIFRTVDFNKESLFCSTLTVSPNLPAGDVLALAQEDSAEAYGFTVEQGAELIPVDDNKSFVVWWEPEGFDITQDTVLVSLHGHAEWAVKGFEVWYPELTKRNYAFVGLQWWFGRSLEDEGYYEPDQIYAFIEEVLQEKGVPPGHVLFEGFSMGSARSYGVALYDKLCGGNYFGVSIANSGQWEDGYPLYAELLTGKYGEDLFEGTQWILFCGEEDYNSYGNRVGYVCDGMEHTEEVLTQMGGTVELFLRDPDGDHGSFMLDIQNRTEALDKADELL